MNWIETIIKEYEDILNDKSISTLTDLYISLYNKHLHQGLCIRTTYLSNYWLKKHLDVLYYMKTSGFKGKFHLTETPYDIINGVGTKEFKIHKIKASIKFRLRHLYQMKDLYYPTKERGITITKANK